MAKFWQIGGEFARCATCDRTTNCYVEDGDKRVPVCGVCWATKYRLERAEQPRHGTYYFDARVGDGYDEWGYKVVRLWDSRNDMVDLDRILGPLHGQRIRVTVEVLPD